MIYKPPDLLVWEYGVNEGCIEGQFGSEGFMLQAHEAFVRKVLALKIPLLYFDMFRPRGPEGLGGCARNPNMDILRSQNVRQRVTRRYEVAHLSYLFAVWPLFGPALEGSGRRSLAGAAKAAASRGVVVEDYFTAPKTHPGCLVHALEAMILFHFLVFSEEVGDSERAPGELGSPCWLLACDGGEDAPRVVASATQQQENPPCAACCSILHTPLVQTSLSNPASFRQTHQATNWRFYADSKGKFGWRSSKGGAVGRKGQSFPA